MPYRASARPLTTLRPPPRPRRPPPRPARAREPLTIAGVLAGAALMGVLFITFTLLLHGSFAVARAGEIVLRCVGLLAGMAAGGAAIGYFSARPLATALAAALLLSLAIAAWQLWWVHAGQLGALALGATLLLGVAAAAASARYSSLRMRSARAPVL